MIKESCQEIRHKGNIPHYIENKRSLGVSCIISLLNKLDGVNTKS